jgi:hypothetical protein
MIKPDVTFALITAFYKYGKTLYASFLPLIIDCVQKTANEYIAIDDLQKKCKEIYGIDFPQNVIKRILIVGKGEGYFSIEKEIIKKNEKIDKISVSETQKKILEEHEYIINNFITFIRSSKEIEITKDQAESAMYEFMEENVYKLIKDIIVRDAIETKTSGHELKISFGQYLKHIIESGNEASLLYISDIAKGLMIQNAIYLPNNDTLERKFNDTFLVLDTPIILSLLGYAGKELGKPIKEFIEIAIANNAKLGVFDFTISEVASILQDCGDRIKNKSNNTHGRTLEYFIEKNFSYEQIVIFKDRLLVDIRKHNIEILTKPEYFEDYYMDEIKLEKCIDKHVKYRHEGAKRKDIDALATTFNLRKGKNNIYLEESKAIFITTNYGLVKSAKEYFYKDRQHIDIAMTDFYITNVLWIKKPIKYPDLPLKRIIADIFSSLQPSDAIWNAFITEVDSMEENGDLTYSDVIALRTSYNLSDKLFEAEENGITSFSPSTIKEILGKIDRDKEEYFKQKNLKKINEKSDKIADFIAKFLSIVLFIFLLIYNIVQLFEPIKYKLMEEIFSFYNMLSFVMLTLSLFNLLCGITINGFKKLIKKYIKKFIFYLFKKIIE